MKVEKLTRKSHFFNEDRFVVGDNFFMVIDGATSLMKTDLFNPTEGSWFVSFIKRRLSAKSKHVFEKLSNISKQAYAEFCAVLDKNGLNPQDLLYYPSAGLALAEIVEDKVVINTIGDCEAVVKFKDGKTVRLVQKELLKLDAYALERMVKLKEQKGLTMKQAFTECKDVLVANRRLMNKPDGYNVFTVSKTGKFEFLTKSFELKDIDEIYLYTDGFAQTFEEFKIYGSYEQTFSKSLDIKSEVEKIVKTAFSDKDCEKYPRFKIIDDIAIIKMQF